VSTEATRPRVQVTRKGGAEETKRLLARDGHAWRRALFLINEQIVQGGR